MLHGRSMLRPYHGSMSRPQLQTPIEQRPYLVRERLYG